MKTLRRTNLLSRGVFSSAGSFGFSGTKNLDDRLITHLICVRLRHLLYDFLGGVWPLIEGK